MLGYSDLEISTVPEIINPVGSFAGKSNHSILFNTAYCSNIYSSNRFCSPYIKNKYFIILFIF